MKYKGIGISNGISLGNAFVVSDFDHIFSTSNNIEKKDTLEKVSSVILDIIKEYDSLQEGEREDNIVVEISKKIITTPSFFDKITNLIIEDDYNVIEAIEEVINDKKKEIKSLNTKYGNEISKELTYIKRKIINKLLESTNKKIAEIDHDFIMVGKEILPSMVIAADSKYIKGVISERGGATSHLAIICRNKNIPLIINVPDADKILKNGKIIYIDAKEGIIITDLNSEDIKKYNDEIKKHNSLNQSLDEMIEREAKTTDEKVFNVTSNISSIEDLGYVTSIKADGVGLLRSEFLYFNRTNPPTEDLQYKTYKSFAMSLKDKPLIIRTFDFNGDKEKFKLNKDIFKTQLRAILKSSKYGNVMIMYPMIRDLDEVHEANIILREAMSELQEEEIPYNKDIKIGITVEVPSVAVTIDNYIDEIDFLSIGTNDLIKYTLASDRNYQIHEDDIYNPAIIRILNNIISSKKEGKVISVCGEIATNPLYIIILVGLGIDELSVNINSILKVKKYISLLNYEECKKITDHILTLKTNKRIMEYLENYAKEVFNIYLDM